MSPTLKAAVSPSAPSPSSHRSSLDWGDWSSHNEAGAVSAPKSAVTPSPEPATTSPSPKATGYAKEDGFDRFMRVMDRIETVMERVTGTSRDELISRNADRAWKGPFHF